MPRTRESRALTVFAQHRSTYVSTALLGLAMLLGLPDMACGEDGAPATPGDVAEVEEILQSENDEAAEYDPWEGMDRNGRIPRAARPPGLSNPGRWRYIPEGRLKPGSVFDRFLVSTFFAPFVFRNGDVGTGGGIALTDVDFRLQDRQEMLAAAGSHTTKGQQAYTLIWRRWLEHMKLPDGGVLQEERSFVRARSSYRKTLTRRFFGIGPDSDEDDETRYTDEVVELGLGIQRSLPEPGDDLVVSLGGQLEMHDLASGAGSKPDTKHEFPSLYDDADNHSLGWLTSRVQWDTRDSRVHPYRGWMVGGDMDAALLQSGWDTGAIFRLYGTKVLPVPGIFHKGGDADEENPPTDVLAFGIRGEQAAGDLPFYSRPTLGGGRYLRGFIDGRFRDKASWTSAVEYRMWVIPRGFTIPIGHAIRIERVGLGFFYEIGAVAHDVPKFFESKLRQSYGFGLRMSLERTAPFRLDFGFSEDGVNISGGFGMSF